LAGLRDQHVVRHRKKARQVRLVMASKERHGEESEKSAPHPAFGAPHPAFGHPLPAPAGRGATTQVPLLPACGEKVPEGRMRGFLIHPFHARAETTSSVITTIR